MAKLPEWFKNSNRKGLAAKELSAKLNMKIPNCVCQEAKCPNRGECFSKGVITFLILGKVCTRHCGFCSVTKGDLDLPDRNEAAIILDTIAKLDLKYVVITSPTRDDLLDGGASHYAYVIKSIKAQYPKIMIEVLVPDFQGDFAALKTVMDADPDVLNHNIETVPVLYGVVRKGAGYQRSLSVLERAKKMVPNKPTKTGLMVGLGETEEQLIEVFKDIVKHGVDILTIGQYLKPGKTNLDVVKYWHPDEFEVLRVKALELGVPYVFAGPMVRSSFLAETVFEDYLKR